MRTITYFVACSLDGFIARPDGGIDWLFHDQDYGFTEFLESIDTVILGRRTWEQALTFGESPFAAKEHFIFSRSLEQCAAGSLVREPVAEFAQRVRTLPGRGIWLVGGGNLAGQFFDAGAVDRLIVFVHPILIHEGLPLAEGITGDVRLQLAGTHAFSTGLVRLEYHVLPRS